MSVKLVQRDARQGSESGGKGQIVLRTNQAVAVANTIVKAGSKLSWKALLFIFIVAIPTFFAAVYYGVIAADQYVTEVRFNLRAASNPYPSSLNGSGAGGSAAALAASIMWDSHAVVQYLKSREIVDQLQQKIDIRKIYSSSKADFLARLDPSVPDEELTEYWLTVIEPAFDMNTGTISVAVRAFTPEESQMVAQGVLDQSEGLVNKLTARAREDALRYFSDEVVRSENALRETDSAMQELRRKYGVSDPARTATLTDNVQSRQEEQLGSLKAQYRTVLNSVGPESPLLPSLKNQISALESEAHTGVPARGRGKGGEMEPDIQTRFDELKREQFFREKAYTSANEALMRARMDFDRQQIYVNAFVHPSIPQMSLYPRRFRAVMIVFGFGLLAWMLACLGVHAVQDHV
ncbi:MAG: hypothetical protein PHW76_07535 [Alphaproteobacteria bacterium]|nr:hypothetical protein [Alphaproteobacteria bacterium]